MKTTTAESIVNTLRNIIAGYGHYLQCDEFLQLHVNGIQRVLVSPYHPSSNGLAERFVQTFTYSLELSAADLSCSLQHRIQSFLLLYRSTPHATTGSSPAKLFLQQELRTRLALVRPDLAGRVASQQGKVKFDHDKDAKFREMAVGETVLARNHLSGQKWQAGTVLQHSSPHSYKVQLDDGANLEKTCR